MTERRIFVNLAVFVVLGIVLTIWASTNVLNLDPLSRPFVVTADFASSPGLQPHFQVAYLGVKVGEISSVKLATGVAAVKLKIDHSVKLPVGLAAAARRQSSVGEPYVDLSPPAGYTGTGPFIATGYVIPVDRTSAPLSYQDLLSALDTLVQSVPPADLRTLVHELAAGLGGRGDTIRQLVQNADSLITTLAQNAGAVDQVIGDLTQLTHVLAEHGSSLAAGFDHLAAVAAALAHSRQDIAAIVAGAPDLVAEVNAILVSRPGGATTGGQQADTLANLGCLIDGLGTVASVLGTPQHSSDLALLLTLAPRTLGLFPKIETQGPGGLFLLGSGKLNVNGVPVITYPVPHQLPAVPAVPDCAANGAGSAAHDAAGPTVAPASPANPLPPTAGDAVIGSVPRARPVDLAPSSSTKRITGRHWPVALLALVLLVLAITGLTRPWRWLPGKVSRHS